MGCCCPGRDKWYEPLQPAYKNAEQVAWTKARIIKKKFLQPGEKVEDPKVGETYVFGNATPPKYNGIFAKLTSDGWCLVKFEKGFFYFTDDLQESKNSKAAFIDYLAKKDKYIRFILENDGMLNKEAFEMWHKLIQNPILSEQDLMALPDFVVSQPEDDDGYYIGVGVDNFVSIGTRKAAYSDDGNTLVAYPIPNPYNSQLSLPSRYSCRALYERSRAKYKKIARNVLDFGEIENWHAKFMGADLDNLDVVDIPNIANPKVCEVQQNGYYAIRLPYIFPIDGCILACKNEGNWTLIADDNPETMKTGYIKAAMDKFEVCQKRNPRSDITAQIRSTNAKLIEVSTKTSLCKLFGNRNTKQWNQVNDGLYYVYEGGDGLMPHIFVEKIGNQFYLRKFHEFRQFIPTSSQEDSKDSYGIWTANLLKQIYYIVDGDEIDKPNIKQVLQGIKIEDLSELPENFKTCANSGEYIRLSPNDRRKKYQINAADPEKKIKNDMIDIMLGLNNG